MPSAIWDPTHMSLYTSQPVIRPYVPLDMKTAVAGIEKILDYRFEDRSLAWEALQAPGNGMCWINGKTNLFNEGNKRMALLGDAWLKLGIVDDWHREQGRPPRAEGERRMQQYATNANLKDVYIKKGIDKFINQNTSAVHGIIPPRTLADTVEALIGAVGMDGGMNAVRDVLEVLGLVEI